MAVPTIVSSLGGTTTVPLGGTFNVPTHQAGDLIVAFVGHDEIGSSVATISAGLRSGGAGAFTPMTTEEEPSTASNYRHFAAFSGPATASNMQISVTMSTGTERITYVVLVLRDAGSVVASTSSIPGGTSFSDTTGKQTNGTIPGLTTPEDNCLVLHGVLAAHANNSSSSAAIDFSSWSDGSMSGFSAPVAEGKFDTTAAAFPVQSTAVTSGSMPSAGASGDVTVTASRTAHWAYITLAVDPATPTAEWYAGSIRGVA